MSSTNADQPNIIFIQADDQGAWALGCAGNAEIRTPNLDRLAATGLHFENFFCVSPVCSPARASILTGRIPSQHGVHDWLRAGNSTVEPDRGGELIAYLEGLTAYTDVLAQNGYTCGISGKWHLGDAHHAQKGFSYWEVHAKGGGPYYQGPMIKDGAAYEEPRYVTDVFTENALAFLATQQDSAQPFYLSIHYTAPHSPWDRDNHPHDLYDDYHANCPFDSIPNVPAHPWQINSAPQGRTDEERRAILSGYYAAVTAMDTGIGRVLDWLEENGLRENTLVFFTSDNGMNMGHHGIYGKGNGTFPQNMYDTSVKVPMIISRPGHIAQGQVIESLLSHYDIMPTLLDYVGLDTPDADQLPGQSFAGLLQGEPAAGHGHVVVFDEYGPVRMIRNEAWKYVHRYPYGPHELYNLEEDPDEHSNLIDSPACQEIIEAMKLELDTWFLRYTDPARDGSREPVTGRGQLGLVGPAGRGKHNFAGDYEHLANA